MVYALLGFLLAPYLLEKNLVEIMQQDFDAELRVEKIEINPFVLSLRINGLELDNPDGEPSARIEEIFTNFQLSSIFRLALTFDEIRFSSPELFVARDESGNMDFSYLIKPGEDGDADEVTDNEEGSSLLQALVFKFAIEDFIINWSDQFQPEPVKTRFGPITIDVRELNTLPNRSGQQSVIIAGVSDSTADGLALRTDQLNQILQLRIDELAASGDAELQYADQRRMALEQLYTEQLTAEVATQKLEALQMQFTTLVEVEGQAEPQPSLDGLAYANELHNQLIELQPIAENDLAALASARAGSLKTALLAIDETLQDRVVIAENEPVTREDGESIEMKVTLGSASD
ncbi:MAG: DUF748 domain-containing protein [Gammaproteobacteria bacterium]|nr:DUF748 domain-containing protein [Gammaproteobacteria bacterium]